LRPFPQTTGTYYVQEYAGGTQLTPASGVPATGTFAGTEAAIGFNSATTPPNEYTLSAGGTAVSLNFTTPNTFNGTIGYITGTRDRWTGAVSGAFNTLDMSGTVSGNTFTGTVSIPITDTTPINPSNPLALSNATITSGTVNGTFYGPAGNEVSGVYQLTGTTSNGPVIIIGSFGAKQ
jgi:hypothetical protein